MPPLTRAPAVAGTFYPLSPVVLQETVTSLLANVTVSARGCVRALIVPHAGYRYSGPVAASGFKQLQKPAVPYQTVYLLGPAHYVRVHGVALGQVAGWHTPIGEVEVDQAAEERLLGTGAPFFRFDPAHEPEHSLEVELPFLQTVIPHFDIVPLLCGDVAPRLVAQRLIPCLEDCDDVCLIVSSDLSHYHPYEAACELDRALLDALLAQDASQVAEGQACGKIPILTLMEVARQLAWQPTLLDYRNSGDTSGDRRAVVGYAAVAYMAAEDGEHD